MLQYTCSASDRELKSCTYKDVAAGLDAVLHCRGKAHVPDVPSGAVGNNHSEKQRYQGYYHCTTDDWR